MKDVIFQVGEEGQPPFSVRGHDPTLLRSKIPGKQGTFVSLTFRRNDEFFDVDLMRGSPDFIEVKYIDLNSPYKISNN